MSFLSPNQQRQGTEGLIGVRFYAGDRMPGLPPNQRCQPHMHWIITVVILMRSYSFI